MSVLQQLWVDASQHSQYGQQLVVSDIGAQRIPLAEPSNPFNGVVPNFNVFGVQFNAAWKKLLGGFWALVVGVIAFYMLAAAAKWAGAKRNGYDQGLTEGADGLKRGALAMGAAVGMPVIVGAIMSLI